MNKLYLLLFVSLIVFSCKKDTENTNAYGTKLVKMTTERIFEEGPSNFYEYVYHYNEKGQIVEIENTDSNGLSYFYVYEGENLIERTWVKNKNNTVYKKDSLEYYAGTNNITIQYYFYYGSNNPLTHIYYFIYDEQNQMVEKITYEMSEQDTSSIEKYYWENGNIIKNEVYDNKGKLTFEKSMEYDDKKNYQYIYPSVNPYSKTQNNMLRYNWADYLGGVDLDCNPCQYYYQYNLAGYPLKINFEGESISTLYYE
ncbi:MAG: hypothetical protein R2798_08890 [Chitinophagales bacterium]|nr:hypothetical protein [Bacteroidota bacterium]MCB9043930.1 hypothetical protein [Chitinophagales bacterium]